MSELICLEQVFLQRSGVEILKGVDWDAGTEGDWALIGLNGSGKTSLLRCATGDFWPTKGRVFLFGGELGRVDLPALKKNIGWVGGAIDKWLFAGETALRLVITGLHHTYEIYRNPVQAEIDKSYAALENLGCAYLAERSFGKLSQGEKQKVRLARALVSEPRLLILDELCAGLDIAAREQVLEAVERMQGPRILFVTHHIEEIPARIGNVLAIKNGRILACGDKREILCAEVLSDTFGVPLRVEVTGGGRYWWRVDSDASCV